MMGRIKDAYRKAIITDHPLMIFVSNVRAPSRLIRRLEYGQLIGPLPVIGKSTPARKATGVLDRKTIDIAVATLREDGICFFPGYFKDEIDELVRDYLRPEKDYEPADRYDRTFFGPTGSPGLQRFVLNETMLSIAAEYYGCQPYLRQGPALSVLHPRRTTVPEFWADNGLQDWPWHIDTPNLLSFHVLLNDTDASGTRMLYAKRSHRSIRAVAGIRTEESVLNRFSVVDCCGPKGTLYIFDNNGLHRPHAVANTLRATFEFYFTPGNQIYSMNKMRSILAEDKARGKRDLQHYGDGIDVDIQIPNWASPLQAEALRAMMMA